MFDEHMDAFRNLHIDGVNEWKECVSIECDDHCECNNVDMEKLSPKIWLTKKLYVEGYHNGNNLSDAMAKFGRCNLESLHLAAVNVSIDDLEFFSGGVKDVAINFCNLRDADGQNIPLEKIMQLFAGADKYEMTFSHGHEGRICNDYSEFVDACQKIKNLKFYRMPLEFDIEQFYDKLSTSKNRSLISICNPRVVGKYGEVFNQILSTKDFDFIPPVLGYLHYSREKLREIQSNVSKMLL